MHKSLSGITVKDAAKGTVSAVFSTFGVVDKDGDVTMPGAIKDGTEVVISAYGHQSHYGALPVGKGVIKTDLEQATLEGQFFLNTAAGRDTFEVVKELAELGEWSYSLQDVTSHRGEFEGVEVNYLTEIATIKEVSPVLIGAGVGTRTLAAKGFNTLAEEIDATVDAVKATIESTGRVVALRADKGKSLSNVNAESLDGLRAAVADLVSLLDTKAAPAAEDHPIPEDIKALAVDFRRRDLFSNLPEGV